MSSVLVDSSFLFALSNPKDINRPKTLKVVLDKRLKNFIVPDVVLVEVAYMLRQHISQTAAINFINSITQGGFQLEPITKSDLERSAHIMQTYSSADFDFVDCCIMALSERLNITKVCTFDHRDFGIFRPMHTSYLELLP
jgi:predicted nucleic acid-binding protein